MPVDEVRARDMQLQPPPSLERIAAFLEEVTHSSAFEAAPEQGSAGIGAAGMGASSLAADVMGRATFGGLLPAMADRNALADKYSVQSQDVREFSQWLVKYRDEKEEAENVVHVQVVDREVPGPTKTITRDLSQEEIEALIARNGREAAAAAAEAAQVAPSQTYRPEPVDTTRESAQRPPREMAATSSPAANPNAITREEGREAVGFSNRTVWGSNLGMGGMAAGMTLATPGPMPMAPLGAANGSPMTSYLFRGLTPGSPQDFGGTAAFHGMPMGAPSYPGQMSAGQALGGPAAAMGGQGFAAQALGAQALRGQSFGGPDMSPYFLQPDGSPMATPNPLSGSPFASPLTNNLEPRMIDSAPGPKAMGLTPQTASVTEGLTPGPKKMLATSQMGQITLVAPPLHVASEDAEKAGSAVAFDWGTLAKGAGPMDASSFGSLKEMLPEGTQIFYPALSPEMLSNGAVNLNLAPALSRQLMSTGYGVDDALVASQASSLASSSSGGAPQAMALPATIVPLERPISGTTSILASGPGGGDEHMDDAGSGQSSRGGALDFLGVPVRLAPQLGATPEAKEEKSVRISAADPTKPQIVRPHQFAPLKNKMFTAFQSVHAEPDQNAWRSAGPTFGLRDSDPHTLLSPHSRVKMPSAGATLPQVDGSSDPLGKSIGMAAHQSKAMEEALTAQPDSAIASSPATLPPLGSPMHLAHAHGHHHAARHATPYGGAAMLNFSGAGGGMGGNAGFGTTSSRGMGGGSSAPVNFGSPSLSPTVTAAKGVTGGAARSTVRPTTARPAPLKATPKPTPTAAPAHLPMMANARPAFRPASTPKLAPTVVPTPMTTLQAHPSHDDHHLPGGGIGVPHFGAASVATPAQTHAPTPAAAVTPKPFTPISAPLSTSAPSPGGLRTAGAGINPSTATAPMSMAAPATPTPAMSTMLDTASDLPLRMPPPAPTPAPAAAVQAALGTESAPAGHVEDHRNSSSSSPDSGNAASEVKLLANEVWQILKRRLATDSHRSGLR